MTTYNNAITQKQHTLILVTALVGALVLGHAIYYWRQPILEYHAFRQTQTAITAYWMLQDGWELNYQTPVAGYPWSIPFEFPIYQSIVALIAFLGRFPLDPTGRFVSLMFLFACAIPAFGIARRLKLAGEIPWVFSSLLWSSPIYLFWGRTFMIETTATFFVFASIPYAIDLMDERPSWMSTLLFMLWMTLGMLQKITTALPVLIVFSFLTVGIHLKVAGLNMPGRQKAFRVLIAYAVPLIIAGAWSYYTDTIRAQNVIGAEMTSRMLTTWNFGTWQQRFHFRILQIIIWERVFDRNLAGPAGILVLSVALLGKREIRSIILISLILFLLPIELFIPLNLRHDYYQLSSTIFIIGGFSIGIVDLVQKLKVNKNLFIGIITLNFVLLNMFAYKQTYWFLVDDLQKSRNQRANQTLLVSRYLKYSTNPDSAIVLFGVGWDSEIAYYAERKSLAVPKWEDRPDWAGKQNWPKKYNELWENPEPFLGGNELGAIVFCDGGEVHFDRERVLQQPLVRDKPELIRVADCYIWLSDAQKPIFSLDATP